MCIILSYAPSVSRIHFCLYQVDRRLEMHNEVLKSNETTQPCASYALEKRSVPMRNSTCLDRGLSAERSSSGDLNATDGGFVLAFQPRMSQLNQKKSPLLPSHVPP